jgi:hypothetical protein
MLSDYWVEATCRAGIPVRVEKIGLFSNKLQLLGH